MMKKRTSVVSDASRLSIESLCVAESVVSTDASHDHNASRAALKVNGNQMVQKLLKASVGPKLRKKTGFLATRSCYEST